MSEAQTHYTRGPSEPPNDLGERTNPLSPAAVGHMCVPHLVSMAAYNEPERFLSYWTGLLIKYLSAEYSGVRDDQWLWSFDREILGYIGRLPGGATFVDRYEREHTLSKSDFKDLPILRIQRHVLRRLWPLVGAAYLWETQPEVMNKWFNSVEVPESVKSPEDIEAYFNTLPSYNAMLRKALCDAFRAPHRAVDSIEDSLMQENTSPHPKPLPNDIPDVPAFDPELLPDSLRPWIIDIAERMQCPFDYPAIACLVVLSAVIGRQVTIRPLEQDDWTVVPNLWGAIIGPPGAMKSPPMKEMLKPVEMLEEAAREHHKREQAMYEAKLKVANQAEKKADRDIKKALDEGDEKRAEEIAVQSKRKHPKPPTRQRYLTQDTTVEKLGELLAGNPNGILTYRDELVGWLRSLEKQGHESARAFYLEAWAGNGRFTFDRIGRGTTEIEAATVSVLGGIQPGPLTTYLTGALKGGAGDDGLLQRFQLAVWPDQSKTWTPVDRKPNAKASQQAFRVFQWLSALHQVEANCDIGSPLRYLRFAPDAQALFKEWREQLESRLRAGNEPAAFEGVLAKQRSLLPSLALIIHLAEHPQGGPVRLTALQKAIGLVEYLEGHARRIYATALDSENTAVIALVKRIQEGYLENVFNYNKREVFTARDVYSKHWKELDIKSTKKAIAWLVDAGWLWEQVVETKGRPTTYYHVNPALLK